jgi:flagellar protein FlgJ
LFIKPLDIIVADQTAQECCMDSIGSTGPGAPPLPTAQQQARLKELQAVAVQFEAVFLAQMLDHAGVGRTPEGFGGGAGEEAFRGHLIDEQARLMANKGGIGLAETIFNAMAAREGLTP